MIRDSPIGSTRNSEENYRHLAVFPEPLERIKSLCSRNLSVEAYTTNKLVVERSLDQVEC
jgi:hypothetical protein